MTEPILLSAERIADIADLYSSESDRAAGHVRELLGHIAALAAAPPPPLDVEGLVRDAVRRTRAQARDELLEGYTKRLINGFRAAILAARPAKAEGPTIGDCSCVDAKGSNPRCAIHHPTPAKAEGLDERAVRLAMLRAWSAPNDFAAAVATFMREYARLATGEPER